MRQIREHAPVYVQEKRLDGGLNGFHLPFRSHKKIDFGTFATDPLPLGEQAEIQASYEPSDSDIADARFVITYPPGILDVGVAPPENVIKRTAFTVEIAPETVVVIMAKPDIIRKDTDGDRALVFQVPA